MDAPHPRIAIALAHFYDKASFLEKLKQLDTVCFKYPVTIYIYNAPHASSQSLTQTDLSDWKTPIYMVSGESNSKIVAYNTLFRSVSLDHGWILILEGSVLRDNWWVRLSPYLSSPHVGLWGGRVAVGAFPLSVHDCFWNTRNNRSYQLEVEKQSISWVDLRFWLVQTNVIKTLRGFEERFFIGDMCVKDISWRIRTHGFTLGYISNTIVYPWKEVLYPFHKTLAVYYSVFNQFLFIRLRFGLIKAIFVFMQRVFIQGVWQRLLFRADYRDATKAGLKLFFTRYLRSPPIHHNGKIS